MADSGVIEAGRLRLVPFAEEHLTERYLGWLRDQALLRFSEQRFRRHTLASCREYRASFQGSPNHFWAVEETGQGLGHVGTMTAYVDERNGVADLGILLGAAEARGRGLALEAWQAACRFLLVEEETPEGLKLNNPAGHLEAGESLLQGVVREALEETAYHFKPTHLVGIYNWKHPAKDVTYLRFAFAGELRGWEVDRKLDEGIVGARWLTLDEVKAIGKALNCSVNDVLLSCVAGAIGGYLRSQGDDPTGQEIRAMIPVNLRPMEEAWKLGNHFGLVPLVLPIGIKNPIERIYEVRKRMNALKGSTQPLLAFAMLSMAGMLVKPAQDALLNLFARKTTAVMTNVPGPRDALTLCGARVTQCMFWVPQSGDIGLGVSILSYGGGVQFGVMTDTTLCPEPQQIIDAFTPEFARLSLLTLMLPWGEG